MARNPFGGGPSDFTYAEADGVDGVDNVLVTASATVLFWTLETGGTQYTDLLDHAGAPATGIVSSDGTDGFATGQIPSFSGPDDVTVKQMWAEADGGPRFLMQANIVAAIGTQAANTDAALAAHQAELNPHGTELGDLDDVSVGVVGARTDGHVLTWDATGGVFDLEAPAAITGGVLLDPGSGGNVVTANSGSEEPWLGGENTYSSGDTNPDFIVFNTRNATNNLVKVFWLNGNMELRCAPSLVNRIAFRTFENAEALNGASTGRFVEFSTNPTNTANREPLFGMYGTAHSSQPGWAVATRVLAGLLGVRAGGSYNSLTAVNFRGLKLTAGAPTSGTWVQYDMVIDIDGTTWLCTVAGTPGTWVGHSANTSFTNVTPGASMSAGSVVCATRLEQGGTVARMRGILVAGGAISSNAVLGTVTAAHRPLHTVNTNARTTAGGNRLRVNTDGTIQYSTTMANADEIWLDNITWDLVA